MITHDMAIYFTLLCAIGIVVWLIILTGIIISTHRYIETLSTTLHREIIENEKTNMVAHLYLTDLITELQESTTLITHDIDNLTPKTVSKETTP